MILPIDIDFDEWADQTSIELQQYGPIPFAYGEENWVQWATDVISIPAIGRFFPPDPTAYSDWQQWATELVALLDRG